MQGELGTSLLAIKSRRPRHQGPRAFGPCTEDSMALDQVEAPR
jgi:hypothetical protein